MFHRQGGTESRTINLEADDTRTYFAETAARWRDLNLTAPYKEYLSEESFICDHFYFFLFYSSFLYFLFILLFHFFCENRALTEPGC